MRLLLLLLLLLLLARAYENLDGELLERAEAGDAQGAGSLLDRGAAIDCRNNFGVSALIWAANNNHLETLDLLLRRGADKGARSNDGRSALVWASVWGHAEAARRLLAAGADVDQADRRGMTALMHAVFEGRLEVARTLLEAGADARASNVYGGTALSIARLGGDPEMVRLVVRALGAEERRLLEAIAAALAERMEGAANLTVRVAVRVWEGAMRLLGAPSERGAGSAHRPSSGGEL